MKMSPKDFLARLKRSNQSTASIFDIEQQRMAFEAIALKTPIIKDVEVAPTLLGNINILKCIPKKLETKIQILYFHGGGYTMGSLQTHKSLTSFLAKKIGATVWSVDYPLAPEHPFPTALHDATSAYEALLKRVDSPKQIIVAGDSAGGGLTVATMLKAKEKGLPMPKGMVLFSPWCDLTLSGWSYSALADRDFMVRLELLEWMAGLYAANTDLSDPFVSPCFGDLSGLPNMIIQVGSEEILLSDSILLAERAGAAGVPVDLQIWPDMPHVFPFFFPFLEAATTAIEVVKRKFFQATDISS